MAALTKNNIGISIILMVIVCLISFPGLALTASAQTVNSQTAQTPFTPIPTNPDFILYALPSYLSVPAGLSAGTTVNATILVMSLYGFNGTVSLSAIPPATGWTASVDPSSVSLTSGYFGYYGYGSFNWSRLSIGVPSGTVAGKYTVEVTGTSGSLTHSVNVTVNVVAPDFYILTFPSYLSVSAGSTVNSTIMVTSLYGFNGTVSLSVSKSPTSWAASVNPPSLSVTSEYGGRYNWSQLSIGVPSGAVAGKYTVTVTGISGSLTHSVNVTVNVVGPDFWISAFPSYLWVTPGSTVDSTIMVMPLYGFNGNVSLTVSAPTGWTASVNPSSLSVTSGYFGYFGFGWFNWSWLSVAVPSDAVAGKYTITVTGTSGSLIHSANVTVAVVQR